ncbi:RagB/SusD family nutrient uptake outer membrane protein [Mucilaginibacter sp. BJC16-A38]|uniref:RagB/SusD family nutrient uptake outer membrane protein n=1 Tax=Mucilaginibacter phenanthrenivorans TaxID=1234842 RepID=UPI0021588276|nr:RagB/SusD family nutrient uptake outer membrane protein [Mucilaginibacter phenanthrenivorans]MCR8560035.1 RagB/SusD family nutrient uptake outer membrane protein [Mucilaginibacter phenanthrenivorans]
MKKIKIYAVTLIASVIAVVVILSCNKDKLNTINGNVVATTDYFNTSGQLLEAVNAAYGAWRGSNLVAREWFFLHDLRSDDVSTGGSQLEAPRYQILLGVVDPSNPIMNANWNNLYTVIHRANTVTDNAPLIKDNPDLVKRIVGEAEFLRGWAYYDLASQWGAVPIYTATVKAPTDYKPKSAAADVFAQAAKDLQAAAAVLPGKSGTDLGRATASAANAMLARVLMQTGDYAGAKAALLKIPTTGADGYQLTNRFLDNFEEETEFNKESIFEVIYADKGDNNFNWGSGTGDGATADQTTVRNQEYNPIGWRNLVPSDKLLNEFESTVTGAAKTDPRYSYTVYQTGDKFDNNTATLVDADQNGNSSTVHGVKIKVGWRKFQLIYKEDRATASFHPGSNNQRILRYAEVLLMLAECENELGNTAAAVGYLNQVRARADVAMPPYPTAQFPVTTKADIVKAIMHEKTAEMADEEVRNVDILRWRKKGYFTTEPLSWYTAAKEFLPIPQSEIDNNPKINN